MNELPQSATWGRGRAGQKLWWMLADRTVILPVTFYPPICYRRPADKEKNKTQNGFLPPGSENCYGTTARARHLGVCSPICSGPTHRHWEVMGISMPFCSEPGRLLWRQYTVPSGHGAVQWNMQHHPDGVP